MEGTGTLSFLTRRRARLPAFNPPYSAASSGDDFCTRLRPHPCGGLLRFLLCRRGWWLDIREDVDEFLWGGYPAAIEGEQDSTGLAVVAEGHVAALEKAVRPEEQVDVVARSRLR